MDSTLMILLIFIGLIVFLVIVFLIVLWWISKNDLEVDVTSFVSGSYKSVGGRYRIRSYLYKSDEVKRGKMWLLPIYFLLPVYKEKTGFFHMMDFYKRFPLEIDYDIARVNIIIAESTPFIGVKQILNVRDLHGNLVCWRPPDTISNDNLIDDVDVINTLDTKVNIENDTKVESKADLLFKFAIPMGLIILAAIIIIFAPNIIEKIRGPTQSIVAQNTQSWTDMVKGIKPFG